jgi:1-acyl-sn-glycerol-3-phosphate acyltransferase
MGMSELGQESDRRNWDAQKGSGLRGLVLLPLTILWAILGALFIAIVATVFSSWFKRKGWWMVRMWGRVPLWWHGIRLVVTCGERAHAPGAKLLLFNHVSVADLLVLASVSPDSAVVIYKQEFHKIPGIGHALKALGCIPVDRRNKESALASMAAAADRVRETEAAVMMAPEGTRSRKGGLQEFKLGAFHLAIQTGAPLVPLIMRGIEQVSPMGSPLIGSGVIAVDFLDPISVEGLERKDVRDLATRPRAVFLEYLDPAPS